MASPAQIPPKDHHDHRGDHGQKDGKAPENTAARGSGLLQRARAKYRLYQTVLLGQSKDPSEGIQVYDELALLLGRGDATMLGRMRETELGRRLLAEREDLLPLLSDRETLRSLPERSLGREYVRFTDERAIFPEELARKVVEARVASGPRRVVLARLGGPLRRNSIPWRHET